MVGVGGGGGVCCPVSALKCLGDLDLRIDN